ncbi:hypothetical protein GSI_03710 [Ganoderma sinense ZZ0214-1]|uniref:Uncharacterized protein n=1 Tax=Ganoderma sinense ZZ0214-1 TaxID=1077348 RepID=A0A2G8SJQ6_9APHY|nr:hypothetical protein GSI_03710 [Ganoderma sinense ZZ0214-1]
MSSISTIAASPNGKWVASGCCNGTIILWDIAEAAMVDAWAPYGRTGGPLSLAFSPNSRHLVSGTRSDGRVALWDLGEGPGAIMSRVLEGHTNKGITSCVWSPGGDVIASARMPDPGGAAVVQLWNANTFRPLHGASRAAMYYLWDVKSGAGRQLRTPEVGQGSLTTLGVAAAFDPGSTRFVIISPTGFVEILGIEGADEGSYVMLRTDTDLLLGVETRGVAFSPNGDRVLTVPNKRVHSHAMRLWDAHTGAELLSLEGHGKEVYTACFSPCGKYVASASRDHTVRLWRTGDGTFMIKGAKEEDAVLCTADKTYTIRSVVLSNSVCVVTPDSSLQGADEDEPVEVFIRDQLSEVIELVPSVPRLHKLKSLLRGQEYDEGHEDEDMVSDDEDVGVSRRRDRLAYDDARALIQASDAELDKGLRDRRVLILKGELRPIAPSHLTTILELLLTNLVCLSLSHTAASISALVSSLEDDHDIRRDITRQVMAWFGRLDDDNGTWEMDVDAVVREVGLGILRAYRDEPTPEKAFLGQWRKTVGDTFEDTVALPLLSGNFLTSTDALADPPTPLLTYFPASALPVDPGARFAELFLARPRWRGEELAPFLADISVDAKERDKLLLKHARAVTDSDGIWYTARAKYSG